MDSSLFADQAASLADNNNATPLHLLCGSSQLGKLMDLVSVLGTPDSALVLDNKDRTPLHVVVENRKSTKSMVKAILEINPEAAQVFSSHHHFRMPFHMAIKKLRDDSIIKVLLRAYPEAIKHMMEGRNTLFHELVCHGPKLPASTLQGLLPIYPDGIQIINDNGNLPLHLATAHQCSLDIIQSLVETYPDACQVQNNHNDLPL